MYTQLVPKLNVRFMTIDISLEKNTDLDELRTKEKREEEEQRRC